jgi:hypothetical protein
LLIGTILASYKAGSVVQTYMGYTNFPCVFFSTSVFLAFKQLFGKENVSVLREKIIHISNYFVEETLGIYCVHWIVLNEVKVRFNVTYSDFMYRIPFAIVTFFASWLIIKVLRKIPVARYIVP